MNPNDFGDVLTFHLAPPEGQSLKLSNVQGTFTIIFILSSEANLIINLKDHVPAPLRVKCDHFNRLTFNLAPSFSILTH